MLQRSPNYIQIFTFRFSLPLFTHLIHTLNSTLSFNQLRPTKLKFDQTLSIHFSRYWIIALKTKGNSTQSIGLMDAPTKSFQLLWNWLDLFMNLEQNRNCASNLQNSIKAGHFYSISWWTHSKWRHCFTALLHELNSIGNINANGTIINV